MNHSNDEESNPDPLEPPLPPDQAEYLSAPEVQERAIEIPASALSSEALDAVIESFILREGTDYGTQEVSYESKVARIRNQLDKAEIKLIFDASTESVTFMTKREWQKYQATHAHNILK
jgi:uncharacterized protein YheU (UPF0270 family)